MKTKKLEKIIYKCCLKAIREVGIKKFKETSLFPSNHNKDLEYKMIIVKYIPAGKLPEKFDKNRELIFKTPMEFYTWIIMDYVCNYCYQDFKDLNQRHVNTIGDLLDTGCGCEIYIKDEDNTINFDTTIKEVQIQYLIKMERLGSEFEKVYDENLDKLYEE